MSRIGRWIKAAALFLVAAVLARLVRPLAEADRRRQERRERGSEIDDRTERAAVDQLPEPTIWPAVLALGVAFGLWGIILNTFFFGMGIVLTIVALAGWMNLLFHEKAPYHEITPTEDPRSL